jgi:hypothetical protein
MMRRINWLEKFE